MFSNRFRLVNIALAALVLAACGAVGLGDVMRNPYARDARALEQNPRSLAGRVTASAGGRAVRWRANALVVQGFSRQRPVIFDTGLPGRNPRADIELGELITIKARVDRAGVAHAVDYHSHRGRRYKLVVSYAAVFAVFALLFSRYRLAWRAGFLTLVPRRPDVGRERHA